LPPFKSYPRHMAELEEVWAEMLDTAAEKATSLGRHEIAEYLRLKATNDAIRAAGVKWLFDTLIEIAGEAQRHHSMLTIEREEPHKFARGNSRMVGSLLSISHGVRCLTVEAGWTRSPGDGVMRGAALAFARITHFGLPREGADLILVRGDVLPNWLTEDGGMIDSGELRQHFDTFLGI
jgi:hypothetical protein